MAEKEMSLKEFVDLGLLQEINRRFLHPMGLALSVVYALGTKEESETPLRFGPIWDARDDPEGICFAEGLPEFTRQKEESVDKLFNSKRVARWEGLNYFIQPTPDPKETEK